MKCIHELYIICHYSTCTYMHNPIVNAYSNPYEMHAWLSTSQLRLSYYRIAGIFRMVQIFADRLGATKIKTAEY